MTPAQFFRIAKAKLKERDQYLKFKDTLNAVQCALLANINRGKGVPAFKADDFRVLKEKKKTTPEEITAIMDRMAKQQQVR